jgi:uncharacterized protein YcaQ
MERLSADGARRVALAAQGFAERRPTGRVDRRHVRRLFDRIGAIQIDSVNVLVRSQELPVFARLGPHRRDLLAGMLADGELFEYWGHAMSLLPVASYPQVRWRMDAQRDGEAGRALDRLERERPGYVQALVDEVRARGPLSAGELMDGSGRRRSHWWGWGDGKLALECLLWSGVLGVGRRPSFEREYDLLERVIPPAVLAAPVLSEVDGRRELVAQAARAMGVATVNDLCDYWKLNIPRTKPRIDELVEEGRLLPVEVEGWKGLAYLDPAARRPRRSEATALLSPFDSLVWERSRTERLFGFHYRIEIYTPAPRRVFGYYVLPFLLNGELVARVDLKADRAASTLRVQSAHPELGVPAGDVAAALAAEVAAMARWLDLGHVEVARRGALADRLRAAIG